MKDQQPWLGSHEKVSQRARMGLTCTMCAIMLVIPGGPARATGLITFINPVPKAQADVTQWNIGGVSSAAMPGGATLATTRILEVQAAGCMEGPCPDAMMVVYQDGSVKSVANPGYVTQVAGIDANHYLAVAGYCQIKYASGCQIHIYALDLPRHGINRIFDGDRATTKQALCGQTFSYMRRTYTVRAFAQDQYNASLHLLVGLQTCRG